MRKKRNGFRRTILAFFVRFWLAMIAMGFGCFAMAAYVPDPPPVAPDLTETVEDWADLGTVSSRAPIGHTHTCANGHTWDHQANAGHTCQTCGLSQYVQDRTPRRVTIVNRQRVLRLNRPNVEVPDPPSVQGFTKAAPFAPPPVAFVQPEQRVALPVTYAAPVYSYSVGGCNSATGSCNAATYERRGLFGLRR